MYLKEVLFILELKKITLADRPLFESYLSRPDQRGSECAFTNLFVWQDCYGIYWTVVHDFLVIKVKRNEVDFFLQPFGGKDEDLPKLFAEIKEYHEGKPFEIHGIYDDGKERLAKAFPEMEFIEDRDNWDYVYLREKLASLSGRKYHGKKNHYNAFKKEYPDYVYERSDQRITKSARLLVMNGAKNVLAKTRACAVSNVLSMKRSIILKHLVCAAALSVSTEKLKHSASVKKSMTTRPFCM